MTGKLRILDTSGHSTVPWDTDKPKTVEDAEEKFNELVHTYRHLAFIPGVHGADESERLQAFKQDAPEIVIVPQMAGGR